MLQELFNSLTPDNIKNIQVIKDAMEIFIANVEAHCGVSIDIANIYDKNNVLARQEYLKIYLDDMFRYFTKAKTNKIINDKIASVNDAYGVTIIDPNFIGDLTKNISNEHFITSKAFKQKKGTKVGIEYIYNLVEVMSSGERQNMEFIEGDPFQFTIYGAVYRELYENLVKPLAHPLGFTYNYSQLVKSIIEDDYQLKRYYDNGVVEVRCLEGTITPYPGSELYDVVVEYKNKSKYTRYYFRNSLDVVTYLEQVLYQDDAHVSYYEENGTLIKEYLGQCSIFASYNVRIELLTTDEFDIRVTLHENDYWGSLGYANDEPPGSEVARIGEPYIGSWTIGGSKYGYSIAEDFNMVVIYNPNIPYINPSTYNGFIVGTTVVGDGTYLENAHNDPSATEDFYDMYNEIVEEFTITLI